MACEIYGYYNCNYLHCFIHYNDDFCFFNRNVETVYAKA